MWVDDVSPITNRRRFALLQYESTSIADLTPTNTGGQCLKLSLSQFGRLVFMKAQFEFWLNMVAASDSMDSVEMIIVLTTIKTSNGQTVSRLWLQRFRPQPQIVSSC
eukprot:Selendium_serpulae@DN11122_c0_g1_i1.p2